jgi:hypothetical protein
MERLKVIFARLHLPLNEPGQDNEVLWEQMNPARSVSLGVSVGLPNELRLVLWVPVRQASGAAQQTPAAVRRH